MKTEYNVSVSVNGTTIAEETLDKQSFEDLRSTLMRDPKIKFHDCYEWEDRDEWSITTWFTSHDTIITIQQAQYAE